jgi:hypothetical protein
MCKPGIIWFWNESSDGVGGGASDERIGGGEWRDDVESFVDETVGRNGS